jgi:hypothetical protein
MKQLISARVIVVSRKKGAAIMRKIFTLVAVVATLGILLAACIPSAPIFRLASNGPSYKIACAQCQEIQTGRTDCANLGSFYVFFDPPSGRTIQTAKVTIAWQKQTMSGSQTVTGTVSNADVFNSTTTMCGNKGWGAHIQPSAILSGFTPNAGDNTIVVTVTVRYSGETTDSAPMTRRIYFLG